MWSYTDPILGFVKLNYRCCLRKHPMDLHEWIQVNRASICQSVHTNSLKMFMNSLNRLSQHYVFSSHRKSPERNSSLGFLRDLVYFPRIFPLSHLHDRNLREASPSHKALLSVDARTPWRKHQKKLLLRYVMLILSLNFTLHLIHLIYTCIATICAW